ncbi:MAG: hypothetical protein WBA17_11085 [Saprospiraceae bacterium]
MKASAWTTFLSYLTERELETTSSPFNPYLRVNLSRGRLQLTADQAIYSYGDLYLNFRRAFQQIDRAKLPERADVLLLGLGLGSIPQMLEQRFQVRYRYTAVEIDEVIIQLASEYVIDELESPIQTICADGLHFLRLNIQRYDMVCMDIFQDAGVPPEFETLETLELLRDTLAEDGLLLYNRLAATPKDQIESRRFFDDKFLHVFPRGHLLPTGGNYMLLNTPDKLLP